MYGHGGEIAGFNAFAASDPKNKVTVVVWATLEPSVDGQGTASLIAKDLVDHLYAK
jgi:D-alanyl-D-alanine carboxypeptidase